MNPISNDRQSAGVNFRIYDEEAEVWCHACWSVISPVASPKWLVIETRGVQLQYSHKLGLAKEIALMIGNQESYHVDVSMIIKWRYEQIAGWPSWTIGVSSSGNWGRSQSARSGLYQVNTEDNSWRMLSRGYKGNNGSRQDKLDREYKIFVNFEHFLGSLTIRYIHLILKTKPCDY
jgi:hypothetical protein